MREEASGMEGLAPVIALGCAPLIAGLIVLIVLGVRKERPPVLKDLPQLRRS
jgi:hypothetical protein